MARKNVILLVDDLDGKVADQTVRFGLDGVRYEIDLSESNATELREALWPFVAMARRATSRRTDVGRQGRRRR